MITTLDDLPATISTRDLARVLGVTPRRVQQLAADRVIPRGPSRGTWPTVAAIQAYLLDLRESVFERGWRGMIPVRLLTMSIVAELDAAGRIVERRLTAFQPDAGASWTFTMPTLPESERRCGGRWWPKPSRPVLTMPARAT